MFRNEDEEVCYSIEKDRTHTFEKGDVVINPSLTAFEETLNKGAGRKAFAIKNDLDDAIHKDKQIFEKEVLGDVLDDDVAETNEVVDVESIVAAINDVMKGLSQADRDKKKAALAGAGLPATPAAIKRVSDASTLNKILDIVKA
jgi:hypothetical protein